MVFMDCIHIDWDIDGDACMCVLLLQVTPHVYMHAVFVKKLLRVLLWCQLHVVLVARRRGCGNAAGYMCTAIERAILVEKIKDP
jgi:hypothetical protein